MDSGGMITDAQMSFLLASRHAKRLLRRFRRAYHQYPSRCERRGRPFFFFFSAMPWNSPLLEQQNKGRSARTHAERSTRSIEMHPSMQPDREGLEMRMFAGWAELGRVRGAHSTGVAVDRHADARDGTHRPRFFTPPRKTAVLRCSAFQLTNRT